MATPNFPQVRSITTNMGPDLTNSRPIQRPDFELDSAAWNQMRAEIQAIEAAIWSCTIQVQFASGTYTVTNCRGISATAVTITPTAGAPVVTISSALSLVPVMALANVCTPSGVSDIAATVQRTRINASGSAPSAVTVYLSTDASFVLTVSN